MRKDNEIRIRPRGHLQCFKHIPFNCEPSKFDRRSNLAIRGAKVLVRSDIQLGGSQWAL
jgi:hypothetical protein